MPPSRVLTTHSRLTLLLKLCTILLLSQLLWMLESIGRDYSDLALVSCYHAEVKHFWCDSAAGD